MHRLQHWRLPLIVVIRDHFEVNIHTYRHKFFELPQFTDQRVKVRVQYLICSLVCVIFIILRHLFTSYYTLLIGEGGAGFSFCEAADFDAVTIADGTIGT